MRPFFAVCRYAFTAAAVVAVGFRPASAASEEPDAPVSVRQGLQYSQADPSLTLDLFLPRDRDQPVPCILVIQGGGFRAQNGQRFKPFAVYLAEHGFAAALIAYRGTPDHRYRDTIADTKAAVRFVRQVSGEYRIDPRRIGAMGRSAGGTLTAMLAVTGDDETFEANGANPEISSRIQAAVAYAGVFDFVSRFTDEAHIALQPKKDAKLQSNGEWIGVPFSAENRDWQVASAIRHVDENDAPVLFLHCKDDSTVPWLQSRDMCAKMQAAGIAAKVKYYETGGHGFNELGDQPMADMVAFFQQTLAAD